MRVGLALPQYDFSLPRTSKIAWEDLSHWARTAEELGFDSVWVSDHLEFDVGKYGGPPDSQGLLECFTSLGALSVVTSRVRLGSLVVCNDLRAPSLVAKMATTIDLLSNGRFDLGMGSGWYEPEYKAAGISFDPVGTRVARFAEAIQVIGGMLSSETFSFSGKYYELDEAVNLPRPVQTPRPPLWVGGKGDRMVRIAGKFADGYNTVWAWTPEAYSGRMAALDRAARSAGREPSTIKRSVGLYCLAADSESSLEKLWKSYLDATPAGVAAGSSVREWGRDKLVGTPDEIVARVSEFAKLGVEEVILGFGVLPFQIAGEDAVVWFAENVLPLIKGS